MESDISGLEDFDDEVSDEAERAALALAIDRLAERCSSAKLEIVREIDDDGDHHAVITLGDQRDQRNIGVYSLDRANALLSIEFEKFKFIHGYEGICNYDHGSAEVLLRSSPSTPSFSLRRLLRVLGLERGPIVIASPALERPTIRIGTASLALRALTRFFVGEAPSIAFEGVKSKRMDDLLKEIRSYSDNIMMQIDGLSGVTFLLQRSRRTTRKSKQHSSDVPPVINYPVSKYNHDAIALYWYAKSARDMPLLRFLAFYQCIEYYFPRYSTVEARKRVSSILKSPTFHPFNDDDIDRIVSSVRSSKSGGVGDERSQLRAVLSECLGADEVRHFIESDAERKDYFSGKAKGRKYHKIPIENKSADLRDDVSDRIYDIRCKIVHTKSGFDDGGGVQMIIPFSEDADYLDKDIELVEFVAKCVLVYSSSEIHGLA